MELAIYVVDAFTKQQFKGNSAAVVPLSEWLQPEVMQSIAAENNLSETAFICPLSANQYEIRWFSPLTEIDFCGHATLAASFVIFQYLGGEGEIEFSTREVGSLFVKQHSDGRIEMSFPNQCPELVEQVPEALLAGLSVTPIQVLKNRQAYFAIVASEQEVRNLSYRSEQLKQLAPYDVVVSAKASATTTRYDFISRYFWPANGGDEDPVTGSVHAGLAPYWAKQLAKDELMAYQASARGGILYCRLSNDRVLVSGFAVLYLKGTVFI
ncbi:PhzF family phenazine biosynthesis protein [Arsukibacterium indicum]|uniref:PhzF family phenazine biosynthesis protein n=1 Tax=Arsukibacterium indicum TaxID=2848612 RepID=A0ABS6MIU6_9GAMM|nr:PhzF family phenazine biosynthesis protein [Arsukibacterium indicum]MBV2128737.1 PhzF family phenazine biosynthesis protein [Arsukibacterium indicum]